VVAVSEMALGTSLLVMALECSALVEVAVALVVIWANSGVVRAMTSDLSLALGVPDRLLVVGVSFLKWPLLILLCRTCLLLDCCFSAFAVGLKLNAVEANCGLVDPD